ncbi:ABC transporter ATP-binding protein [Actinomadura barringtoniae]|uniref:ABC transporter ATP-binding protein n=1 Tax=Actinomadura barringtoniae TaxID=1427535 RepID=A0A939PLV8_9ACTN|nr:ABC transporter ATP-binding protein [Actinomadura barringtoniae]MBO2454468.1 ABC transporter ATP-binding protein [Actinomadura barringtoniae]
MDNEAMVTVSRVGKTYGRRDNKVAALDDVSVRFPGGRFTAVMGPSGSGKSTLLQCAAGIDRVDSGEVELAGTFLNKLSESALTKLRRDRIGFVFQAFNLVPSLTARQNVALPLMLAGRRPKRRDVDAALDRLGLADRRRHRPGEMSGGQQQRVAIARALVTRPQVLFADEPTGALDSRSSRQVMDLLRELVDQQRQTIVMVTHDPVAASFADEVLFLADGRIAGSLEAPTPELVAARITKLEEQQ